MRDPGSGTADVEVGGTVLLLQATEIAPGSLLHLQPGDTGTVVKVTETECTATFSGATIVVPLDEVQPVS